MAQAQIATGRRFLTASDNPALATRAVDLADALAQQAQLMANTRHADNFLASADSAITEISDLITEGSVVASQTVSNLTSAAEREAESVVVAAIRRQLQNVGNRQFMGRYIFGGRNTLDRPFVDALGAVGYVGDTGNLLARVGDKLNVTINMSGSELFSALSDQIATDVVLTPKLTESTRLDDIVGANGGPIREGVLVFNEVGGVGAFSVDLDGADTIGDVVDLINASATDAGAGVTATLGSTGITITPGGTPVSVTDNSTGVIAGDLGILTVEPTSDVIVGDTLAPRLTRLTPVAALAGGAGIDFDSGLVITNGGNTVTLDFSSAETVQDVINAINNAGVFVLARINDAGTRIDVFNQVSGTSLTIGENGGSTAADLGIRTFDAATPLSQLNFGRGVKVDEGQDDLHIVAKDGSTVDVNLDGAVTVGDVITLINAAAADAGVAINAGFTTTGNGISLTDNTAGGGGLSVSSLNLSTAALDLGLAGSTPSANGDLVGDDVNPTRTEGIIGALIDLERALIADDTRGITMAGSRLDELSGEVTRMHGIIGARSQAMTSKLLQTEQAATTTKIFLSEIRDLDYTEAVTRMQSALTQLQGNLQASGSLLNLSLMDFLR